MEKRVPPSERLRLTIAYDGTAFSGWQSQPNCTAVQDHLISAFRELLGIATKVHGAGRTDAGVHAMAQVAHADVPKGKFSREVWLAALNAHLPPELRVLRCQPVGNEFHARFSARGKVYRYRIWNAAFQHPLEINRSWHIPQELSLELMRQAAAIFLGKHDFAAFAANRGTPSESTVRTISTITIRRKGPVITLEYSGDGFLYRMVRLLTGSIVQVALRRRDLNWLKERLLEPKGRKSHHLAPACGLYLVRVKY
ncbi:MAG TPA: tRNA pseudouridine(38-40) synthase TruA [Chthoniobacterales bacterium]|nr:tRNA pseudouridine(38-40) synthase TruA [Chthoniobacterales bacterium]